MTYPVGAGSSPVIVLAVASGASISQGSRSSDLGFLPVVRIGADVRGFIVENALGSRGRSGADNVRLFVIYKYLRDIYRMLAAVLSSRLELDIIIISCI